MDLGLSEAFIGIFATMITLSMAYNLRGQNRLWKDIKHSNARHDVTDRIVGTSIKKQYDSSRIAEGNEDFPEVIT